MRPNGLPPLFSSFVVLAACSAEPGVTPEAVVDFEREVESISAAHGQHVELDNYARFYTGHEIGEGRQLPGPERIRGFFVPGSIAERTGVYIDEPAEYPPFEDDSQCPSVFGADYDMREGRIVSITVCGEVLTPNG